MSIEGLYILSNKNSDVNLRMKGNFDNNFTVLLNLLQTFKMGMNPSGQNFEFKIQLFDQKNTAEQKNGVGNSFGVHLWG